MIVLITGVPGSGKTAFAVGELLDSDKPVAVLNLRSDKFRQLGSVDELVTLRNMSVLIDEAQAFFRDEKMRYWFETHRHYGMTVYLTTQGTIGIPRWMRPLIGRHVHITSANLSERRYLEWPRIANPLSSVDVRAAAKAFAPVRRDAFDYYKSVAEGAEMPPIHKRRIPLVYLALAGVMVAAVAGGVYGYKTLSDVTDPAASKAVQGQTVRLPLEVSATPRAAEMREETNTPKLTVPNPPPTQTQASQPLAIDPVIVGCVANGDSCRCYDAAATVVPTTKKACQARIRPY